MVKSQELLGSLILYTPEGKRKVPIQHLERKGETVHVRASVNDTWSFYSVDIVDGQDVVLQRHTFPTPVTLYAGDLFVITLGDKS